MFEVATVNFHSDTLQAVRDGERVWVVVKRVCEALGLDNARQQQKLKDKAWACVDIMPTHDTTGREQKLFCLDLDSLPMWLATIEPSRVKEAVRGKLVDYQKECARVLRDHFFGPRGGGGGGGESFARLVDQVAAIAGAVASLVDRITALEAGAGGGAYITERQHGELRSAKRNVAEIEFIAGTRKNRRQALASIDRDLRLACGLSGSFVRLPAVKFPCAMAILDARRANAERVRDLLDRNRQIDMWGEPGPKAVLPRPRGPLHVVRNGDQ